MSIYKPENIAFAGVVAVGVGFNTAADQAIQKIAELNAAGTDHHSEIAKLAEDSTIDIVAMKLCLIAAGLIGGYIIGRRNS